MVKVIQDLWIVNEAGIVLFSRVYNEKVDAQLFGSLLSALNSFAEELDQGGLSNFVLGKKEFTILKMHTCLFIASSSKRYNQKLVSKELRTVAEKFFDMFPPEMVKNWDGNVKAFNKFEQEIKPELDEFLLLL